MSSQSETGSPEQPLVFSQRVQRAIPGLFLIWLVLTVFAPHQDLFKAFFHLIIVPAALILVFTKRSSIDWKDPFLLVALVYFAYAGVMTFFIGLGPLENHIRALRWSIEITLGLIAFFIWMPHVISKPDWWGKVFLWLTLIGSATGILMLMLGFDINGRLVGLGALHNAGTASYILLLYFALGHFMLTRGISRFSSYDKTLLIASLLILCLAVLLAQTRISIAAMLVYLVFLAGMELVRNPRFVKPLIFLMFFSAVVIGVILFQTDGVEEYINGLLARGLASRDQIWAGYLMHIPDAWLLGFGAGTEAKFHPAFESYWKPNNFLAVHTHNLFLGILVDTGVIGVAFFLALVYLVMSAIAKHQASWDEKIRLTGILVLIFMLSLTGGQTIIISIKTIWLYLWIPVVFIWFWTRQHKTLNDAPA